ncbi:GvpL/GvpF family gas vesicle protein [Actinoalloteichus spitiensis]|uniref:GvpL/GvpF family gas vesicle protein n=1 Tax=Actinoalloteichus spitiensis TaxID=252394 RepID=UPI00036E7F0C|nr:GvpL/GvpF family gas vesicle protein [Actinoalloteichus spitiensis]
MTFYLYGIIRGDHPADLSSHDGVGPDRPPLRVLRDGGLAVVVSEAPRDLRGKRRDLIAHQRVLDALGEQGAVLPFGFGVVSPDEGTVLGELAGGAAHFSRLLDEVDQMVEINVKVTHREDVVLRQILLADPELLRLNERTREGAGHQDRLRLGELVAGALDVRRREDASAVLDVLGPAAHQVSTVPSEVGGPLLNASFLVPRDGMESFHDQVAVAERRFGEWLEIRVVGPLPPYSFVDLRASTAA